jgi:ABC-type branched-subunit amino acid transport system substrate-binding protein
MRFTRLRPRRVAASACAVLAVVTMSVVAAAPSAGAQVRGFDGSTVTVGGYGIKSIYPSAEDGAQARIQQFNDDNEIKGVKIKLADFADDNQDPATALSEVRRLVTEENVFALVPEISLNTPGDYITQQKVPDFGGGFTGDSCSDKQTTKLWFFGFNGCQVTTKPTVTPDTEVSVLKYVREQSGKQKPTVAVIGNDTQVGKTANKLFTAQYKNGGWGKLVYAKANVPPPPVSDVTPYVQDLMTADNGNPPDFVRCGGSTECISIYTQMRAAGFKGEFESNLYSDQLAKVFEGSIVAIPYQNPADATSPGIQKLTDALNKVKPGEKVDAGVLYGYMTTDMFVSALKKAYAKDGKAGITPDKVQQAAATQTWQIKDLAGPTKFPASTVKDTPSCRTIVKADGTGWTTVEPYSCTTLTYPVK